MNVIFLIWLDRVLHLQYVWQKVRQQCGRQFLNKIKKMLSKHWKNISTIYNTLRQLMQQDNFSEILEKWRMQIILKQILNGIN